MDVVMQCDEQGGTLVFDGWNSFHTWVQFMRDRGIVQCHVDAEEDAQGKNVRVTVMSFFAAGGLAEIATRRVCWRCECADFFALPAVQRYLIAHGFVLHGSFDWWADWLRQEGAGE